jgi:hypothetical protein
MQMSGEAVGAIMFIGLTVVFSLLVWFRYKATRDNQDTIRAAIDKGQELSPELLERLTNPPAPANRDLRRGMMGVGLAFGFVLFGFFFPEEEELFGIMSAVAMFPMLIGVAYLLLHRFGNRG